MNAQKQLILGRQSFHFAVNRISYLEGVRRRGFWARPGGSKSALRKATLKKQLFSPESKVMPRAGVNQAGGLSPSAPFFEEPSE
jgi:hypothetical protein